MNTHVANFQKEQNMSANSIPIQNTDLESIVGTCHQMALVYLRKKIRGGVFDTARFGIAPEDVATFVITSLFRKNEQGECVDIASGFRNYLQEGSAEDYLHRVRQMTFSAVEEELSPYYARHTSPIFDSFREELRAAVEANPVMSIEQESGCRWIVIHEANESSPYLTEPLDAPVMPLEFLEIRLGHRLPSEASPAELLETVRDVLREHSMYRPAVPLPLVVKVVERIRGTRTVSSPSPKKSER